MSERPSFSSKLSGWLQMGEKIALSGLALGLILRYMGKPVDQILLISLSVLAGVYFLTAYMPPAQDGPLEENKKLGFTDLLFSTILPKIIGIGSAVAVIGVLFAILHLSGSDQMLFIGLNVSAATTVFLLIGIAMGNEKAKSLMPFLYRLLLLTAVTYYYLNA